MDKEYKSELSYAATFFKLYYIDTSKSLIAFLKKFKFYIEISNYFLFRMIILTSLSLN